MVEIEARQLANLKSGMIPVVAREYAQQHPLKAFESFVADKLGNGGQIVDVVYPKVISVQNNLENGNLELTIFRGDAKSLQWIFKVAACVILARKVNNDRSMTKSCLEFLEAHPWLVSTFALNFPFTGPMFIGERLPKTALFLGTLTNQEDLDEGLSLGLDLQQATHAVRYKLEHSHIGFKDSLRLMMMVVEEA